MSVRLDLTISDEYLTLLLELINRQLSVATDQDHTKIRAGESIVHAGVKLPIGDNQELLPLFLVLGDIDKALNMRLSRLKEENSGC